MNRLPTGGKRNFPPNLSSDFPGNNIAPEADLTNAHLKDLSARSHAIFQLMQGRSNDECLDVSGTLANPTGPANVVAYTPNTGSVAKVTRISIVFSNPFLAMTGNVGWRVLITGAQPAYMTPYQFSSMGNIFEPIGIYPLWVQSNDTIALQVVVAATFTEHLVVIGRIAGQIFKPSSPQIVSEV